MIVVVRGRCGLNTPTSSSGAFLVVVGCLLLASFLLHADLTATATIDEPDVPARLVPTAGVQNEIDAFMEKVLARRETKRMPAAASSRIVSSSSWSGVGRSDGKRDVCQPFRARTRST